jgi:hypothetical protein
VVVQHLDHPVRTGHERYLGHSFSKKPIAILPVVCLPTQRLNEARPAQAGSFAKLSHFSFQFGYSGMRRR